MKKFIGILSLIIAVPFVEANQRPDSYNPASSDTKELQQERNLDYRGDPSDDDLMQKEEEAEFTTPEGREIEQDRDVLGDDEMEIND